MEGKSRKELIKGAFCRLMINNMLLVVAICACGLIDNLFIGRVLGKDALAAVSFFSPVTVAIGICYVLILGTQVLTGNLAGKGEIKKVNSLFAGVFVILAIVFTVFSVCCMVFNRGLASLLGADGKPFDLLCEYINGYAPGILPQVLTSMLMALCPFNNEIKRSYCAIGAMVAGNVLGDWLLIESGGIFGVGLASTISSLAALLVLLPGFFKKDKLLSFSFREGVDFRLVLRAAARGLPSLMLTIGVIIKNYCFNYSLNHYVGTAGVAVAGIMATVSAMTGAVPSGCSNAYSALAGIYFGEEDRESLIDLTRIAMRIGVISCAAVTGLIMVFSSPLSRAFVPNDSSVQALAQRMFLLTFTYLVPNVIFNILLQAYRAQSRMLLVNIMSFAETTVIGLFSLFAIPSFGADAAWISNFVVDVLCIIVVLISVICYHKRFDLSVPALLKLSDDFGAKANEYLTFSAVCMNDVTEASKKVIEFCLKHDYPPKTSNLVGLCVEEMTANVLKHGFEGSDNYYADIRVVLRNGGLTVRIRDNCREFDPRKRIDLFDPTHPETNIGIRIVSKTARQIDYYNNAGINTVIMKF